MQNTYYVIDAARMLHTVKADSLEASKDVFNDGHKVRLDLIEEATVCQKCKGIHTPDLPDWITYRLAPGQKLCCHHKLTDQPAYIDRKEDTGEPQSFFKHSKQFV